MLLGLGIPFYSTVDHSTGLRRWIKSLSEQ